MFIQVCFFSDIDPPSSCGPGDKWRAMLRKRVAPFGNCCFNRVPFECHPYNLKQYPHPLMSPKPKSPISCLRTLTTLPTPCGSTVAVWPVPCIPAEILIINGVSIRAAKCPVLMIHFPPDSE